MLRHINKHPSIRYRELSRATGLPNGLLSFDLKKLEKLKIIKVRRLGYSVTRCYPKTVKANESSILDHLLDSTRRKIIFFLLEHRNRRFKEILHHIKRDPSTTSVQLQRLEHTGIIFVLRLNKNNHFYRLKNKSGIIRIVSKYKIIL
jgi:predicted transcriptional regulator